MVGHEETCRKGNVVKEPMSPEFVPPDSVGVVEILVGLVELSLVVMAWLADR